MDNIPHGSYSTYTNHACRCDLCREAAREHHRQRREADPKWQAKNALREYRKTPEGRKEYDREKAQRHRDKEKAADPEAYFKKAAEEQRRWRENNPERFREIQQASQKKRMEKEPEVVRALGRERTKRWKETNPEAYEKNRKKKFQALRLRRYQLTPAEYDALLLAQGGVCAICGKVNGLTKHNGQHQLVIDHCHGTGAVRGLLCYNCNLGLGNFKDDLSLLQKAIRYLEQDNQAQEG